MRALCLLLVAFTPPQEQPVEKTIGRTEKDPYITGVRELDKAIEMIDSEPDNAITKISNILGNSKIKHFEVRLKIEMRPQEYDKFTFYPYYARGRAYMSLGKQKAADVDDQIGAYQSAVADFEKSVAAKVPKSAGDLEAARKALDDAKERKRKADIKDPIVDFKRSFDPMMENDRYKAAAEYLAGPEGQKLSEEQRKEQGQLLESNCTDYIERQLKRFRDALRDQTVRSLRDRTERGFQQEFSNLLPGDAELTEAGTQHPVLKWARANVKVLSSVRSKQAKAEDLLSGARDALPLDPPDADEENFWFNMMASLGAELTEEVISASAAQSERKPKAERVALREAADKALATWKQFLEKTDKKVVDRHFSLGVRSERLDKAIQGFAVELDLAKFNIIDCYLKHALPGKALADLEQSLLAFESNLNGRVAIESRQELYTKIVNAGALWRIMEGKPESQVIREVKRLVGGSVGDKLKEAGGPLDPGEYGPKVRKVFEGL